MLLRKIRNLVEKWLRSRPSPAFSLSKNGISPTIGIPRTLVYYLHPLLWETFFQECGFEVVVSKNTGPQVLQKASLISEAEHCLPVKLLDGHVDELAEKADLVFIPRILSVRPAHIACPKLGALPDAVKADFGDRIEVLTLEIDERRRSLQESLHELGRRLGVDTETVRAAADKAREAKQENLDTLADRTETGPGKDFLLLSHPYNLQTSYLVDPIVKKLESLGGHVEYVDFRRKPGSDGPVKWDMCSIMHEVLCELDQRDCAGVIQLTSFNCGCDSIVGNMFRDLLRQKKIPLMTLILDEHTAQAGVDTRLEAFVDSIKHADGG